MDSGMYSIVLLVLMFALLYFFMIRPENKRKKQAQAMRDSLTVGDEITTIGGIIGTICAVKENTIVIETGATVCGSNSPSGPCPPRGPRLPRPRSKGLRAVLPGCCALGQK